ncbi:MAG: LysR family transcriptional regulator [Verrucomicrobiales bacterium]
MFELRHLKYFVAVAEEGSINRAAARLRLTQPALSRQIRALEDEVGECLLSRTGNSIRLTEAGQLLLGEARGVLERAESAPKPGVAPCAGLPRENHPLQKTTLIGKSFVFALRRRVSPDQIPISIVPVSTGMDAACEHSSES